MHLIALLFSAFGMGCFSLFLLKIFLNRGLIKMATAVCTGVLMILVGIYLYLLFEFEQDQRLLLQVLYPVGFIGLQMTTLRIWSKQNA